MAKDVSGKEYILGQDIGARSVGWARIGIVNGEPSSVLDAGVRCFEAGVDGDIEQGRDASRAKQRRDARAARRMLRRRARRMAALFKLLQRNGLLPDGPSKRPEERDAILKQLDRDLRDRHLSGASRAEHHVLPYRLRAMALDAKLELHELGRALYHLAQRRGFLSNRRKPVDDKEAGVVKEGINRTHDLIESTGSRTLGEALSRLDPEEQRIRQRYTERAMYLDEFERIWAAQAVHHPGVLTESLMWELRRRIFHQRPLKPQSHLVGQCELEPGRRRAPMALPAAQRFRMLQKVNDVKVIEPTGELRALTSEERTKLLAELGIRGSMTFDQVRKLLGLTKAKKVKNKASGEAVIEPGHDFNLATGGEDKMPGDNTTAKLLPILGQKWTDMPEPQQNLLVRDILDFERAEALAEHLERVSGFDAETARKLSEVTLTDQHAAYSAEALRKLTARMEDGTPFMTARDAEYPRKQREPVDILPPVLESVADLRNPAVCRALTEVRKVVNELTRKHGKPAAIRVELARDLKSPRKAREAV